MKLLSSKEKRIPKGHDLLLDQKSARKMTIGGVGWKSSKKLAARMLIKQTEQDLLFQSNREVMVTNIKQQALSTDDETGMIT